MADINFGDVIYVDRGLYKHFGIYSGKKKVIHYTKDDASFLDGTIQETSLSKFMDGERICCVCNFDERGNRTSVEKSILPAPLALDVGNKLNIFDGLKIFKSLYDLIFSEEGKLYSPEETVSRARNCIGQKGYDLLFHNCEHFAVWCKTGVEKSAQIDEIIDILAETGRRIRL